MKQIQFVGITPQELSDLILNRVKEEIQELKTKFQPKIPVEYLSRKEVAELLKVNLSTIHNYCKSKKLKAYSLGNRVYFKRSEVEAVLIHVNP